MFICKHFGGRGLYIVYSCENIDNCERPHGATRKSRNNYITDVSDHISNPGYQQHTT